MAKRASARPVEAGPHQVTLSLDPPPNARRCSPHPSLARSVRMYFTAIGDGAIDRRLPDGCVDLLVDLSGVDGAAGSAGATVVVGSGTAPLLARRPLDDFLRARAAPSGPLHRWRPARSSFCSLTGARSPCGRSAA